MTWKEKVVSICNIDSSYAKELSDLILNISEEYSKYFTPFSFDEKTINSKIKNSVKDQYFGIFTNSQLSGFYMIRGLDDGYTIPSYGVWISPNFSGLGLAKKTIIHALEWCEQNNIKKLMVKAHPDNLIAKKIYESFGFIANGIDQNNKNIIYYKNF